MWQRSAVVPDVCGGCCRGEGLLAQALEERGLGTGVVHLAGDAERISAALAKHAAVLRRDASSVTPGELETLNLCLGIARVRRLAWGVRSGISSGDTI